MEKEECLRRLRQELEIRNFSNETVKSYINSVDKFLAYALDNELNQQMVKDYIHARIKHKNPSTVSHDIFAIQFFFWNVLGNKIYIPRPKKNKVLPDILTIEEAKMLVNAPSNVKHRLILKMLYGCGLRVGEIIKIAKSDVDFTESLIHVRLAKGR